MPLKPVIFNEELMKDYKTSNEENINHLINNCDSSELIEVLRKRGYTGQLQKSFTL
jgi:hypothetical protein